MSYYIFADDFFGSNTNDEEITTMSSNDNEGRLLSLRGSPEEEDTAKLYGKTKTKNDNEDQSSVVSIPEIPDFDIQKLNFKRVVSYPLNIDLKSNDNNKK